MIRYINDTKIQIDDNVVELLEMGYRGSCANKNEIDNINRVPSEDEAIRIESIVENYIEVCSMLCKPYSDINTSEKYDLVLLAMKNKDNTVEGNALNEGLLVKISDNLSLIIRNRTWAITVDKIEEDYEYGIEKYEDSNVMEQLEWAKNKLLNGEFTDGYFEKFAKELFDACDGDSDTINMASYNLYRRDPINIVKMNIAENSIVDVLRKREYLINIFDSGEIETDDDANVYTIYEGAIEKKRKKIKVKGYQILERKYIDGSVGKYRIAKDTPNWITKMAGHLLYKYVSDEVQTKFHGAYIAGKAFIEIDRRVYMFEDVNDAGYIKDKMLAKYGDILNIIDGDLIIEDRSSMIGGIEMVKTSKINAYTGKRSIVEMRYEGSRETL